MADKGNGGVDPTLKLSDERLREVYVWLCGERFIVEGDTGAERRIVEPTASEIASGVNEAISKRTACGLLEETCTGLEKLIDVQHERLVAVADRKRELERRLRHRDHFVAPDEIAGGVA